jgi:hypothetical protein
VKTSQTKNGNLLLMSDLDLSKVEKTRKSLFWIMTFLVSMMVLVAIYTTIKNGFTFFTVFPLFFTSLVVNSWSQLTAVRAEIKSRKLN